MNMTQEELQFEIHKLLDAADQDGKADEFLLYVMHLYGQYRILNGFVMSFCNDDTQHYTTEAFKILMEWKMAADGVRTDPAKFNMTHLETLQ
jgi:hypothetical protein